jgi:hypothetical protein
MRLVTGFQLRKKSFRSNSVATKRERERERERERDERESLGK